ncbi:MAG: methyltransferase domain-containing protein [Candidatus Aenigmarchaeota archaeon]|nr:methyltransferase domain-containing protein [Candidatus Aenigmarchaeota archaeon]
MAEKTGDRDFILLCGEKNFLVQKSQKIFHSNFGTIDITRIKQYGQKIRSSSGTEFTAIKPTAIDMLKKCRRMPQVILPKDAGQIVSVTGLCSGWRCMDAGAGSGFLSIFLGSIAAPSGKVYAYERDRKFAENARNNMKMCGLEGVVEVKSRPAEKMSEKELDLITLDMQNADKLVKKAKSALKAGGWLCIYSPQIEQQKRAAEEMRKHDFSNVRTIETIQRDWHMDERGSGYSHPKPSGIMHTGFMTFGRKIS